MKQFTNNLHENEELYRLFIDNILDILIECDLDAKFLYVSPQSFDILGYTPEELIGSSSLDYIYPGDVKRLTDAMKTFKKIGDKVSIELRFIHKDGYHVPVFVKGQLIEVDLEIRYVGVIRDLTEKKKIKRELIESEEKYRGIIDNSYDGYIETDLRGYFTHVNQRICEILGYAKDELIGKQFRHFMRPEFAEKIFNSYKLLFKNKLSEIIIEIQALTKDGKKVDAEAAVYLRRNFEGEIVGFYALSRNIALRQKLKESEEKYREAYIQSNFFKDIISHDINNVLQNIKSSLELYKIYQNDSKNFEKLDEVLGVIDTAVFRGAKLISNVQKLSELKDADIPVEKIEICQILEDSMCFLKKCFQDKKIDIKVNTPSKEVHVKANALLLDVFENILDNAVKYNDSHAVELFINISKEIELDTKKYIKMEFTDNGIGIPDTRKKEIFQKGFKKVSNVRGLGIGLSLVKNIIESYKGQIWVEDRIKGDYSKGSIFVLLIPEVKIS